ncbi:hypothetical protein L1049_009806 [Liquidambar formosana]|uniref:X8 domain-containing protein n=1 Tax=Liquidambar formosana TaxID=63359 RepID=A0AAP0N8N4_LIQFO
MAPALLRILVTLLFLTIILQKYDAQSQEWCIANDQASTTLLQSGLDWACGKGGADCTKIQVNQPCYLPNTVKDHASFAFNSYYQKTKHSGGSCSFQGAAVITTTDPIQTMISRAWEQGGKFLGKRALMIIESIS